MRDSRNGSSRWRMGKRIRRNKRGKRGNRRDGGKLPRKRSQRYRAI